MPRHLKKIALFAWFSEQNWSCLKVCLVCQSRIDQAGLFRLICLSRIDQVWKGCLICLNRTDWFRPEKHSLFNPGKQSCLIYQAAALLKSCSCRNDQTAARFVRWHKQTDRQTEGPGDSGTDLSYWKHLSFWWVLLDRIRLSEITVLSGDSSVFWSGFLLYKWHYLVSSVFVILYKNRSFAYKTGLAANHRT